MTVAVVRPSSAWCMLEHMSGHTVAPQTVACDHILVLLCLREHIYVWLKKQGKAQNCICWVPIDKVWLAQSSWLLQVISWKCNNLRDVCRSYEAQRVGGQYKGLIILSDTCCLSGKIKTLYLPWCTIWYPLHTTGTIMLRQLQWCVLAVPVFYVQLKKHEFPQRNVWMHSELLGVCF